VLLVALIGLLCVGALSVVGNAASGKLNQVGTVISPTGHSATTAPPTTVKCKKKKGC
jgi:hypothetical protein